MAATEAVPRNSACQLHLEDGTARLLEGNRVSSQAGNPIGIPTQDLAAGEYGWFCVYGVAQVRTSGQVDQGYELWPTGDGGVVSNTTNGRPIDGMYVSGAAVDDLAPVVLSEPKIAAQASTGTGASNVPDAPATPDETTRYDLQVTSGGQRSWQPTLASDPPEPSDASPQQP